MPSKQQSNAPRNMLKSIHGKNLRQSKTNHVLNNASNAKVALVKDFNKSPKKITKAIQKDNKILCQMALKNE